MSRSDPQYEHAAETVDHDTIWGVKYRIMCEYNQSFVPIKNYEVNPGIDGDNNEAKDDENE